MLSPMTSDKRGRGRPTIDAAERRTHLRNARFSPRELDLLVRLADHLNTTEGDVLRLGLEALAREQGVPT